MARPQPLQPLQRPAVGIIVFSLILLLPCISLSSAVLLVVVLLRRLRLWLLLLLLPRCVPQPRRLSVSAGQRQRGGGRVAIDAPAACRVGT